MIQVLCRAEKQTEHCSSEKSHSIASKGRTTFSQNSLCGGAKGVNCPIVRILTIFGGFAEKFHCTVDSIQNSQSSRQQTTRRSSGRSFFVWHSLMFLRARCAAQVLCLSPPSVAIFSAKIVVPLIKTSPTDQWIAPEIKREGSQSNGLWTRWRASESALTCRHKTVKQQASKVRAKSDDSLMRKDVGCVRWYRVVRRGKYDGCRARESGAHVRNRRIVTVRRNRQRHSHPT